MTAKPRRLGSPRRRLISARSSAALGVMTHHPALIARGSMESEPLRLGKQFLDRHFTTGKAPFPECLARRVQLGQSAALYCRVSTADQTCARQERDLRAFAKKA